MQTAQIDALCISCREGITNPICPSCLGREMESWNPKMKSILLKAEVDFDYGNSVDCLFCREPMHICAHCYSRDVYDLVRLEFPEIALEFIEVFDYGLREELT